MFSGMFSRIFFKFRFREFWNFRRNIVCMYIDVHIYCLENYMLPNPAPIMYMFETLNSNDSNCLYHLIDKYLPIYVNTCHGCKTD